MQGFSQKGTYKFTLLGDGQPVEKVMELLLFTCMLNGDSVDGKKNWVFFPVVDRRCPCQSSITSKNSNPRGTAEYLVTMHSHVRRSILN